jgi:cytochrome c
MVGHRVGRMVGVLLVAIGVGAAESSATGAVGDPQRGAGAFARCAACHSTEPGEHLTGPSLARIWGRRAGTVEGFGRYSEALKGAGVTWDDQTLARFLADPQALIPGNAMTFPGVPGERERADLVAFLKALGEGRAVARPGGGMMAARPRAELKSVGPEWRVRKIRYCGDAYHVTTESGRTFLYWEFNLRFKTDSGKDGPEPGKPVLVPAGMGGDRAFVVFRHPEEISATIERRC